MSNPTLPPTPQFQTAEYASEPGGNQCKFCHQPLMGSYYRINRSMACASCAAQVRQKIPQDSHPAFVRALLFGAGGAILGLILYSAVGIITGWTIGYVALAVGWMVGKAMMRGSGGVGGRRYQIAAVLLTYAAVSLAAVPIYIAQEAKTHHAAPTQQSPSVRNPGASPAVNSGADSPPQADGASHPANFGKALVVLTFIGLASPFLELADPFHGLIGLVILFVGIQFAWKMTRGVSIQILGPFKLAAPPANSPASP
jgi:hypothetical protein